MFLRRGQTGAAGRFGWLPEVMVITAAAPVLGSLVNPSDPYMLHSPFPWLMLAPLAVALQHGLWAGLTSSIVLSGLAGWQALSAGSIPGSFASWSIGCAVTAMIAGQIRDSVRSRSEKLAQRADSLEDRLERSERTRHLIQLSHAKLEERVAAQRSSLASAIEDAEHRMSVAHSMHELGQVLLDALATQGHLHSATLYVAARDHGILLSEPVASFGGTGESSAGHALVVRAFKTGKLAAIVDAVEAARNDSSVLAAVPLITARRRTVGVVAVHQMPFMVFHAEHLNQVFVLAGHLADRLFDRWAEVHGEAQPALEADTRTRRVVVRPVVSVDAILKPAAAVQAPALLPANAGESVAASEPGGLDITVVDDEPESVESVESVAVTQSAVETQPVAERRIVGVFEPGRSFATQTQTFEATIEESSGEGAQSTESPVTQTESAASMEEVKAVSEVVKTVSEQTVETKVAFEAKPVETQRPRKVMGKRAREAALKAALEAATKAVRESATDAKQSEPAPAKAAKTAAEKLAAVKHAAEKHAAAKHAAAKAKAANLEAPIALTASIDAPATPTTSIEASVTSAASIEAPKLESIAVATETRPDIAATPEPIEVVSAPVATLEEARSAALTILPPPPASEDDVLVHEAPVRASLPAPVESARSAILAAFARKANEDDTQPRPATRPAPSFRIARVTLNKQPASEAPAPRSVTEVPAPAAVSDERAISFPPAKAADARASVRAAFQKTRNPADDTQVVRKAEAPAPKVAARSDAHSEIRIVTADARAEAKPAQSTPISDLAPRSDIPEAKRPSIEQARAAMLATVAKARSLLGKPRAAKPARIAEPTTEARSTRSHATRSVEDVVVAARSN